MAHDERQYSAADGTHQAGQKGKQGGKQKGKQGTQKLPKQKKTPEEIAELKRRALEEKEANPHAALDRKIAKAKEAEKMRMAQIAAPSAHPPSYDNKVEKAFEEFKKQQTEKATRLSRELPYDVIRLLGDELDACHEEELGTIVKIPPEQVVNFFITLAKSQDSSTRYYAYQSMAAYQAVVHEAYNQAPLEANVTAHLCLWITDPCLNVLLRKIGSEHLDDDARFAKHVLAFSRHINLQYDNTDLQQVDDDIKMLEGGLVKLLDHMKATREKFAHHNKWPSVPPASITIHIPGDRDISEVDVKAALDICVNQEAEDTQDSAGNAVQQVYCEINSAGPNPVKAHFSADAMRFVQEWHIKDSLSHSDARESLSLLSSMLSEDKTKRIALRLLNIDFTSKHKDWHGPTHCHDHRGKEHTSGHTQHDMHGTHAHHPSNQHGDSEQSSSTASEYCLDEGHTQIAKHLPSSLRELHLKGYRWIGHQLHDHLNRCTDLRVFVAHHDDFSDLTFESTHEHPFRSTFKHLTKLEMQDCKLQVFPDCSHLSHLSVLSIENNASLGSFFDKDSEHWSRIPKHVTELYISKINISKPPILTHMTKLGRLHCNHNPLKASADSMIDGIPCGELLFLKLRGCGISQMFSLEGFTKAVDIDLTGNPSHDDEREGFLQSIGRRFEDYLIEGINVQLTIPDQHPEFHHWRAHRLHDRDRPGAVAYTSKKKAGPKSNHSTRAERKD